MLKAAFSLAQDLSREAGQMAMHYFRSDLGLHTEYKEDFSPVTQADREIELFLRQEIQKRFPEHGILGEEFGAQKHEKNSDYLWILDPIDGTRSFAHGIPVFGIQLALTHRGIPIIGVIHLPALQEHIAAAQGMGCFWNGRKAQVSKQTQQQHVLAHVHERDLARHKAPDLKTWLAAIENERNWGDCYSFVLAATGRVEVAMDPRMQVWDSAPLPILMQEAGGVFFDWQGQQSIWNESVVCTTPHWAPILQEMLENGRSLATLDPSKT